MATVLDRACADALSLARGGMDAVLVENFGDTPFERGRVGAETCAALTLATAQVRDALDRGGFGPSQVRLGVNVLRNDAHTALGIAVATGADFMRVNVHTGTMFTDQGRMEGNAASTLRDRARLAASVLIAADVHVKHGTPPAGEALESAARDTRHRGLADILIVSGSGTGAPVDVERLTQVRRAVPETPLWVGSGVTAETIRGLLQIADGVIVGSSIQEGGRGGSPVDPRRVEALVAAAG